MNRTRRHILAALFTALAVSLGYALAAVPNVELMTITVFLSGYLLGARLGTMVGVLSMAVHSLMNPMGAALPPLMLAQTGIFAVVACTGALFAPLLFRLRYRGTIFLLAALAGCMLSVLYDLATNIAAYYVAIDSGSALRLWQFVSAGMAFTILHVVWNTGLFLVVLPPAIRILAGYRNEVAQTG